MTRRGLLLASALLVRLRAAGLIRMYLKDGSYQPVREYKVEGDRVKFYSTDRSDWEEMPADLVDLKRTEAEIKEHEEARKEELKAEAAEDKAERDVLKEIARIPQGTGVYAIDGEKLNEVKQAEPKVVNNKGRHVLKMVSPIPLVSDKSWLEVDGLHSSTIVRDARPEFYFRLNAEERFGILKMSERKGNRVVEKLTIVPVTKEVVEEPDLVPTFRQQVGDLLYKIWPEKAIDPGEYAVVEYTEGKVNMMVWDFAYVPKK